MKFLNDSIKAMALCAASVLAFSAQAQEAEVQEQTFNNSTQITVVGDDNGHTAGVVNQAGEGNRAVLAITGTENNFEIDQSSDGAENNATLMQDGADNFATITQSATGLTDGPANIASISQIGTSNIASINQIAVATGGFGNEAQIVQDGTGNNATSEQMGSNNFSRQVQVGNNNSSAILQHGSDNIAIHEQFGDNLSLPDGVYGTIGIEQYGNGMEIMIQQCSDGC